MDKEYSKIKHIMGKYYYIPRYEMSVQENRDRQLNSILGKKVKPVIKFYSTVNADEAKERTRVFEYFYALDKNDNFFKSEWERIYQERRKDSSVYALKPVRERRDNQHPENYGINYGSWGSSGNRIRVPSKKHKNRYEKILS